MPRTSQKSEYVYLIEMRKLSIIKSKYHYAFRKAVAEKVFGKKTINGCNFGVLSLSFFSNKNNRTGRNPTQYFHLSRI